MGEILVSLHVKLYQALYSESPHWDSVYNPAPVLLRQLPPTLHIEMTTEMTNHIPNLTQRCHGNSEMQNLGQGSHTSPLHL